MLLKRKKYFGVRLRLSLSANRLAILNTRERTLRKNENLSYNNNLRFFVLPQHQNKSWQLTSAFALVLRYRGKTKNLLVFTELPMVGEMVQNSQSLFSFTFNVLIDIHEYIYSHSTTKFTFKKYIYSHLPEYFLFTIIFAHIYEMSSFTFNELYPFTFTIKIFIQHFLRITFAHRSI